MQTRIGILGGGQLGRMLIQSAINFDVSIAILDPDAQAPCSELTHHFVVGDLADYQAVYNFGKSCDIVTVEIEKVNTQALRQLQNEGIKVFPQPDILELIQDKRLQKQFYTQHHFPTADFVLTDTPQDLLQYAHWLPAVHKLGRDGYDGRGVQVLQSHHDWHKAFDKPSLLEKMVEIDKEIAVIVARNSNGETRAFPPVESVFHPEANLVEYLFSPADVSETIAQEAERLATQVIETLGMVGLLAVEFFLDKQGNLLINEVAPRPHNSGHTTIEANHTSQFEQHLRAILNYPLGNTDVILPAAMVNLLGEEGHSGIAHYQNLDKVLKMSGVHLHLYGKKLTKPFRKMGHVTIADANIERLREKTIFVKETLKVISGK